MWQKWGEIAVFGPRRQTLPTFSPHSRPICCKRPCPAAFLIITAPGARKLKSLTFREKLRNHATKKGKTSTNPRNNPGIVSLTETIQLKNGQSLASVFNRSTPSFRPHCHNSKMHTGTQLQEFAALRPETARILPPLKGAVLETIATPHPVVCLSDGLTLVQPNGYFSWVDIRSHVSSQNTGWVV